MYEELKNWQTGLGALLGFIALMIAALWNFHLNRVRDKHLRTEEVRSIAAALYGEIILLRSEVADLAKVIARLELNGSRDAIDVHFTEVRKLPEPIIYPALASKLGMLDSETVLAITEFHKNFQKVKQALSLLVEDERRKYSFSSLVLLKPARDAVHEIAPTLRVIERMNAISIQAADPDLGMAEDLIEMEERKFDQR